MDYNEKILLGGGRLWITVCLFMCTSTGAMQQPLQNLSTYAKLDNFVELFGFEVIV